MLVLTRKKDQSVMIGDKIEITVLEIKGDHVRLGINAPKDVAILREEIYKEAREVNRASMLNSNVDLSNLKKIIKIDRNMAKD